MPLNKECIFSQISLKQTCLLSWALQLYYPVRATNHINTPMLSLGKKVDKGKTLFCVQILRHLISSNSLFENLSQFSGINVTQTHCSHNYCLSAGLCGRR